MLLVLFVLRIPFSEKILKNLNLAQATRQEYFDVELYLLDLTLLFWSNPRGLLHSR